ncbi:hypothetical protein H8959_011650 [Pygathrix nigripes]
MERMPCLCTSSEEPSHGPLHVRGVTGAILLELTRNTSLGAGERSSVSEELLYNKTAWSWWEEWDLLGTGHCVPGEVNHLQEPVTSARPHSCPGFRRGLVRARCTRFRSPTAGVEAADSENGVGLNWEGAGGTHCADCAGVRTQLSTSLSSCSPLKVVQAAVSFSLPFCFPPASRREGEFPFPAVFKGT